MENTRVDNEYYRGCMLGAAVANPADGLMQLALFTAEGLLRAIHRAKMHGSNGTFVEIVYESYRRWLRTQRTEFDAVSTPANDGWLLLRPEMYVKGERVLTSTLQALDAHRPGDIGKPLNTASDYEGVLRIFPVGLMFPGMTNVAFRIGMETVALTHGSREAFLTGGFLAALISALAGGMAIAQAIEAAIKELAVYRSSSQGVQSAIEAGLYLVDELAEASPEQVDALLTSYFDRQGDPMVASHVVAYGIASVLCHPFDYAAAVSLARRYPGGASGGASDGAAMIAGLLCGLKLGEIALPHDKIEALPYADIIVQVAEDLLTGIRGGIFIVDREWLRKYPGW